jgi:uncharacterized membrane protein
LSESVFEFLFKYRRVLFAEGELGFATPWPVVLLVSAGLVVAALAVITYARAGGRTTAADRVVLAALRVSALAVIVLLLLRPVLVLTSVVPQRNFLAVLVDDSRSMAVADVDGTSRGEFARTQLDAAEGALLQALQERFAVRLFRFADSPERLADATELSFQGSGTRLAPALTRAHEDLAGVPLSGLVVLSDGADTSEEPLTEALLPLQAAGVPVFTVGLGDEALTPDVQLGRVDTPPVALLGTTLVVDVVLEGRGFGGRTVTVMVEDDSRILASREVELNGRGEPVLTQLSFTLEEAGPRRLQFSVPPLPGERVERNNARELLIDVRDQREKILYFEGEPRFEVKFIRRAVAEDENLRVVVLQRTAENKFLRLDVDDAEELAGGFPRTREELFRYKGLILGSVEASFFTHDQLNMIADFVSQRGGGLLALGGRRSFGEGGYSGTPVAEVLPVVLPDVPVGAESEFYAELEVEPTRSGLSHAVTQLAEDEDEARGRWAELPPLSTRNRLEELKPGATALLLGRAEGGPENHPVLAFQRYGRGMALSLAVQDVWTWQMHASIALEDMTHETLWRQLLRWVVDGVPEIVSVTADPERIEPGRPVTITAQVADSGFFEVNDGAVDATVTLPSGDTLGLPLDWTVERDGEYSATFTAPEEGLYEIEVSASRGGEHLGSGDAFFAAAPSDAEFFDAGMRAPLLRRVAEDTGGRFYTPETLGTLPEDITYTGSGVTLTEERDLWDMPAALILLVLLVVAEWTYRRTRGLA